LFLREGSEYEDLGLIASIHEAMSTIPGIQVHNLLSGLEYRYTTSYQV
jgi:hypothetical protein